MRLLEFTHYTNKLICNRVHSLWGYHVSEAVAWTLYHHNRSSYLRLRFREPTNIPINILNRLAVRYSIPCKDQHTHKYSNTSFRINSITSSNLVCTIELKNDGQQAERDKRTRKTNRIRSLYKVNLKTSYLGVIRVT